MIRPAEIPLSFAQRRLWFLDHLEGPQSDLQYTRGGASERALEASALEAALGDLVGRHESLDPLPRSPRGASPADCRAGSVQPVLKVVPISEADLPKALNTAAEQSFELSTEIPFRAQLFRLAKTSMCCCWCSITLPVTAGL